jgi:rubrerythrin
MRNELSERLRICIAIEAGIGEIYDDFAKMFPGASDLWGELAREEENHASILAIGNRYANLGKLPAIVVPDSLTHMRDTLGFVDIVKATVQSRNVSIDEALEMSLKLEQTLEEGHLPDVMTHETDSEVVARLQRLLADTRSHIVKIKDYMKRSEWSI